MINKVPDEIVLEVGQRLDSEDLLSFYAVSRRFRRIMATLLSRIILVNTVYLPDFVTFVSENHHFASSVGSLLLILVHEPVWLPESASDKITGIRRRMNKAFSEELNDILLKGDIQAYVLLLLASLDRLSTLHVRLSSDTAALKYKISELLSHPSPCGFDLSRLWYYTISDSELEPEGLIPNLMSFVSPLTPVAVPTESRSICSGSSLKEIQLVSGSVDIELLKLVLSIPNNLRVFFLDYTNKSYHGRFPLAELGDTLRLQAHSLRDITIFVDYFTFPPAGHSTSNLNASLSRILPTQMCLGGLQDFKVLTRLELPFDVLFGPGQETTTSLSKILPASLEDLVLQPCIFENEGGNMIWGDERIVATLCINMDELFVKCPRLTKWTVFCLSQKEDIEALENNLEKSFAWRGKTQWLDEGFGKKQLQLIDSKSKLFELGYSLSVDEPDEVEVEEEEGEDDDGDDWEYDEDDKYRLSHDSDRCRCGRSSCDFFHCSDNYPSYEY